LEIVNTPNGYEKTPRVVISFNDADGVDPESDLIADADGDLFGTTAAQEAQPGHLGGTVFEITDSGFVTSPVSPGVPADLIFQNTDGQAAIWSLTGTSVTDGGAVNPNPGPGWKAVATGDVNADGHADILWQNTGTGQVSIWEMDGNSVIGGGSVSPNPGPSWKAIGTGDFNDDLHSDILLQNTNGQLLIWEMDGKSIILDGAAAVVPNPGPAWQAVGTGDFNDDGDSDILLQNKNTGQMSIWEMKGNSLIGGGPVAANPGPAWQAIGTGDFNHDGFSDILLRNKNTGAVSIWEMKGTNVIGGGPVANPGLEWHVIGTGSEGASSDIVLQNTSGQVSIWEMNGNTIAGGGPVGPNPGSNWRAVGLGL
jgi:VCBS repeat protein/FG-GAP repeat protein/tryptophan-rich protein